MSADDPSRSSGCLPVGLHSLGTLLPSLIMYSEKCKLVLWELCGG